MDSFMEKLVGRLGTSDVIKANSEAEARAFESAKRKNESLENAISDMRRLSLKCVETNEATGQLVSAAIEKIEEIQAGKGGSADADKLVEELRSLKESIDAAFKSSGEEAHKENVRVYRNVQASVIEELKQQSEAIAIQHSHIEGRLRGIKPIAIIALCISGINLFAVVAFMLLYFGVI